MKSISNDCCRVSELEGTKLTMYPSSSTSVTITIIVRLGIHFSCLRVKHDNEEVLCSSWNQTNTQTKITVKMMSGDRGAKVCAHCICYITCVHRIAYTPPLSIIYFYLYFVPLSSVSAFVLISHQTFFLYKTK